MPFDARILEKVGVKINALVSDSRQVKPGDTFVAYPGDAQDGRKFIEQAIRQGANAIIWESEGFNWHSSWQLPNVAVSGLRQQLGYLASHVYGTP